ncbi:MAG: hypothetical protein ACEQSR_05780 [Candidatus Methylacidiphilales bacterium]
MKKKYLILFYLYFLMFNLFSQSYKDSLIDKLNRYGCYNSDSIFNCLESRKYNNKYIEEDKFIIKTIDSFMFFYESKVFKVEDLQKVLGAKFPIYKSKYDTVFSFSSNYLNYYITYTKKPISLYYHFPMITIMPRKFLIYHGSGRKHPKDKLIFDCEFEGGSIRLINFVYIYKYLYPLLSNYSIKYEREIEIDLILR